MFYPMGCIFEMNIFSDPLMILELGFAWDCLGHVLLRLWLRMNISLRAINNLLAV
jgi:hypothetical protein